MIWILDLWLASKAEKHGGFGFRLHRAPADIWDLYPPVFLGAESIARAQNLKQNLQKK
jgi:hypothetical protein